MKTIDQTLPAASLGTPWWWYGVRMYTVGNIDRMRRGRTDKHLSVDYKPSVYKTDTGQDWTCQHASTHLEKIERFDEYREAVTGILQPVRYDVAKVCDDCPAIWNNYLEEWQV